VASRPSWRLSLTAALLLSALLAAHVVETALGTLLEPIQAQAIDRLFRIRAGVDAWRPPYDGDVVLVPIDDRSIEGFEDFYIGRVYHARLVRALGRAGLAAQFHDMIFAAPLEQAADLDLAEATREAGHVYYGMAVGLSTGGRVPQVGAETEAGRAVLEAGRWDPVVVGDLSSFPQTEQYLTTFPALAAAAQGMAFLDVVPDRDGVNRRVQLLVRDGERFLPSLSLLVLCDYLQVTSDRIELRPGRTITLHDARRPGAAEPADIRIPIDRQGRMIVNFIGPWGSIRTYPAASILEAADDRFAMEDLRAELEGRIAVVAWVATGRGDIGSVPTDPIYPKPGIHANVMNTILSGRFLRELSPLGMLLIVEFPLIALLFVAALRTRTISFLAIAVGLMLAYGAVVAAAFFYLDLILRVPIPILAVVGGGLVIAAFQYHQESSARAVLRNTFDAYFPRAVVDKIMRHSHDLVHTVQKKELTILFSDIKNFTSHTATLEPERVRSLLNEYFERMGEIVFEHRGTLDKFIGDGLMVFFGDPEPQPDHAQRAVRAALDMQRAARDARRLSYTVLGEPVNLAQRLESSAPAGGILISARTHAQLDGAVPTRTLEPIRVKGFDDPIAVYEVPLD